MSTIFPFNQVRKFLLAFVGCVTPLVILGEALEAQEVGDRVVVTANFDTLVTNKKVDKVFEGNVLTVTASEGRWRMLSDVKGWIPVQYLMNLDMGVRHFSKRIKDNPNDSIAYAHRGMIFHEKEEFPKAFTDLNQSLTINRNNSVAWLHRGMVLKAQNKMTLAAKDFRKSIELNPKLANAHYNIGLVFYALNDYKQSIKAYDQAIKLDDTHSLWYVNRGNAKLAMDDFNGAKRDYEKANSLDDSQADGNVGLSNLALIRDDLENAYKYANAAVQIQPAIFDLTRAIRRAPKLSIAYGNRGICYVYRNEFDKAIDDHTRNHELDPRNPIALLNRGVAWLGKGDFEKAKQDFEAAEKLAPELGETLNGFAWFLATCPGEKYRDGNLAVAKAKVACEGSQFKDWDQLDTLAAAHAESGDFDEAVKWAQKALDVAPEDKKKLCEEQIARFKNKEPFRSKVGKNAEHSVIDG